MNSNRTKCVCSKEAEISEMHTMIKSINKELTGPEGLIRQFPTLKTKVNLSLGFLSGIIFFIGATTPIWIKLIWK